VSNFKFGTTVDDQSSSIGEGRNSCVKLNCVETIATRYANGHPVDFETEVRTFLAAHTSRLLAALDGMDRGCVEKGFQGQQNGYGEPNAGDELQAARDELAALVGHVAAAEDDEPESPWVETPMPTTCI